MNLPAPPRIISSWLGLAAVWALASAFGAAAQNSVLSLRQALDQALLQNRQLQIERINPEIARLTLRASRGFYDPVFHARLHEESAEDTGGFDPANFSADAVFSADSEVASIGLFGALPTGLTYNLGGNYAHSYGTRNFMNFDSYKVGTGITLEQPLLRNFWIDQPRWAIQVNKRNLKISELGVHFIAMTVINLTQQGYYDLMYAWETLRVQQQLIDTREQFVRAIQRQVELGMMTALEEKLAISQTATVRTELITASNAVALASNHLRTLMGVEEAAWDPSPLVPEESLVTVPETFETQQAWRNGLRQRPDLLQLAVNLESADLTVKFRKNQLFPTLNLFGSYGLRGADAIEAFPPDQPQAARSLAFRQIEERNAPSSAIGLFFSVPLARTADRAHYQASKEARKQAELILKQKEELLLREISDALDFARFSLSRAESSRLAVRYAVEALEAEETKLLNGTGSVFLVLQAQTDLSRARIAEIAAKRDYNRALSQVYFTEGTLLDRVQFELDFR